MNHKNNFKTPIFYIFSLVLIWRIVLWLFAFVAKNRFSFLTDPTQIKVIPWEPATNFLLSLWARWDSAFYLGIAKSGYYFDQTKAIYNVVFFPLYPLLMKGFSFLLGGNLFLSGVILSFIFTFLACVFLYKLARFDFDDTEAKRSVFYFLIFPTAIFLAAIYNESLFVFLICASLYYARSNKWLLGGLLGFFAALTRPQGILLFPVLFLEYLEQRNFSFKEIKPNCLNVLWPIAGLGLFMSYLQVKFGNAFLFLSEENLWGRKIDSAFFMLINALNALRSYFHDFFTPHNFSAVILEADMELIFFLTFFIFSVVIFLKLRKSYGLYVFLGIFIPLLTGTLYSIQRFTLILFPVFIYLAKLGKNQIINFIITLVFSLLFGLSTILFVNWYWTG